MGSRLTWFNCCPLGTGFLRCPEVHLHPAALILRIDDYRVTLAGPG